MSNNAEFFIEEAASKNMAGWDFSQIKDRFVDGPLPWSYLSTILPLIAKSSSMLDLDTGGGEFLADLSVRAQSTSATEGYEPNIKIATERLKSLGVNVVPVDRDTNLLAFPDQSFDLVLGRHAGFSWQEVKRVLRPGGLFVSQQVGSNNHLDLEAVLGVAPTKDNETWDKSVARTQALAAGFELLQLKEAFPKDMIFDVGALIFQLRAVSWQIPDFSVERYREQLEQIQQKIDAQGYVEVTSHRFLFVAKAI